MNRREKYLKNGPERNESDSWQERLSGWWRTASFGLALSGRAGQAAAAGDRAVLAAETARDIVQQQAVYAMLDDNQSVRQIADHLRLSRSAVGRIVKSMVRGGELTDVAVLPPVGLEQETKNLVLEAWSFANLKESVEDHSRSRKEVRVNNESGISPETALKKVLERAAEVGAYAQKLESGIAAGGTTPPDDALHHLGDDTGRLISEAFELGGAGGGADVIDEYLQSLNDERTKRGIGKLSPKLAVKNLQWAIVTPEQMSVEQREDIRDEFTRRHEI